MIQRHDMDSVIKQHNSPFQINQIGSFEKRGGDKYVIYYHVKRLDISIVLSRIVYFIVLLFYHKKATHTIFMAIAACLACNMIIIKTLTAC